MAFNQFFFKKYREVLGDDVWKLVRDAFSMGSVDASVMETPIVLIPKVDHLTIIKEFRPISLCNVIYKAISPLLKCWWGVANLLWID